MLCLVGVELEKNSGTKRNYGRWSDTRHETFPEIAVLINGFGIFQNILPILQLLHILISRRICSCIELEASIIHKIFDTDSSFYVK